jgi:hypothetical protein
MGRILSSWKEIANYLGKGVRTVQRWEGTIGLPVRRPTAGNSSIVLAYTAEIDEWLNQATSHLADVRDAELLRLRKTNAELQQEVATLKARCEELESERVQAPIAQPSEKFENVRRVRVG